MAKPIAVVMAKPQASTPVSASVRPAARSGSDRRRSKKPCSTSSATPAAVPVPANSTLVITKPGTRKST